MPPTYAEVREVPPSGVSSRAPYGSFVPSCSCQGGPVAGPRFDRCGACTGAVVFDSWLARQGARAIAEVDSWPPWLRRALA